MVSQFTLCAVAAMGRRPAFINARKPPLPRSFISAMVSFLKEAGVGRVDTGKFGAEMLVSIENDGPVTILLDTDEIMKHREAAK